MAVYPYPIKKNNLTTRLPRNFYYPFWEYACCCFLISICFKFYEKKDRGKYLCPPLLLFFPKGGKIDIGKPLETRRAASFVSLGKRIYRTRLHSLRKAISLSLSLSLSRFGEASRRQRNVARYDVNFGKCSSASGFPDIASINCFSISLSICYFT